MAGAPGRRKSELLTRQFRIYKARSTKANKNSSPDKITIWITPTIQGILLLDENSLYSLGHAAPHEALKSMIQSEHQAERSNCCA
jgi:hypothetical protein